MLGRTRTPVEDGRIGRLEQWAEHVDRQLNGLVEGHGREHSEISEAIQILSTYMFSLQMDLKEIKKRLNIEDASSILQ